LSSTTLRTYFAFYVIYHYGMKENFSLLLLELDILGVCKETT
jgi:hypothetical protein